MVLRNPFNSERMQRNPSKMELSGVPNIVIANNYQKNSTYRLVTIRWLQSLSNLLPVFAISTLASPTLEIFSSSSFYVRTQLFNECRGDRCCWKIFNLLPGSFSVAVFPTKSRSHFWPFLARSALLFVPFSPASITIPWGLSSVSSHEFPRRLLRSLTYFDQKGLFQKISNPRNHSKWSYRVWIQLKI